MAGILKVDTLQNSSAENMITQTNSTTLTIGTSGDTVTLAAGATSSGFGATYNGAINWDTTAKTSGFTAVSGVGYFVNTTSGSITVTLPITPSAGAIIAVSDYAKTWDTNNCILGRNGSNINGGAVNYTLNTEGLSVTLVYVDSTKGWIVVNEGNQSAGSQALFVTATGGTVLTCGNYKTHIFTGPGSFVVSCGGNDQGSNSVEYLVVAGGGGASQSRAGGGGAGGYRQNYPSPTIAGLPVTATTYPITIGSGGAGSAGSPTSNGTPGSNSVFSTITSAGGGASNYYAIGSSGGSGGGGGLRCAYAGGAGNTPPVSPPQGNPGGPAIPGNNPGWGGGGGGGGAGATGGTATPSIAGAGGVGSYWSNPLFGPTAPSYGTSGPVPGVRYFAGGGGGGAANATFSPTTAAAGGSGGGGSGGQGTGTIPVAGTVNTGGGGGGGGDEPQSVNGSAGGSGIVVIRYKYQ